MTIRKASKLETDYILRVSGHVIEESTMGYATNNLENGYNMFQPIVKNGAYYLVDDHNREIRGWILLGSNWNPLTGKVTGNLLQLYVFPLYRNFGIGKKLMEAAIHELQSQGIGTIQLNVFAGNPAKSLYKKLGFREISTVMEIDFFKKNFG
ncbi:GNAT family N-acetyltransferase [Neobacillus sp. YIM B06451]|uniref:GNAT family N-acetyltransferase n=1 Tax=Neobacillus sp. YIM B06451 TaxID=3070994 RepID=UPI002931F023|nr:GNAT family N-acetyltransferase [Neobacillus sp. YIM B06451]